MKKFALLLLGLGLVLSSPSPSYGQNTPWKVDNQVTKIIKKVTPSVVSIYLIPSSETSVIPNINTIYGTGVIVDSRGLILTSLDLVNQPRSKIVVFLTDGRRFFARRIGQSPKYGVALLKISAQNLSAIPLGDSTKVVPGALCFKFGNAFQTAQNFLPGVNMGTISGIDDIPSRGGRLLRTDAGINRGDYGGPLVDVQGRLLGVLVPLWIHRGTNTYVSYAVPVEVFKDLIPEMKGYMGVLLTVNDQGTSGAEIEAVDPNGPAAKAGIRVGDYVVTFGKEGVKTSKDLVELLKKYTAGDRIEMVVARGGRNVRLYMTLGEKVAD